MAPRVPPEVDAVRPMWDNGLRCPTIGGSLYIFDSFPSREAADTFAETVVSELKVDAQVYDEQRDDIDPTPVMLEPPVVYVERGADDPDYLERALESGCEAFGGRYVGT
jgi:hypothetical protein